MDGANGESRLDRIERMIESLTVRIENLTVNIESLHSSVGELHEKSQEHDRWFERHSLALDRLAEASRQDGEHIRALARIAGEA